jgi:hypothetical protein
MVLSLDPSGLILLSKPPPSSSRPSSPHCQEVMLDTTDVQSLSSLSVSSSDDSDGEEVILLPRYFYLLSRDFAGSNSFGFLTKTDSPFLS